MGGALLMAASMPRAASSGAGSVSISFQNIIKVGTGATSVTASYTLDSDGKVYKNASAELETWLISGAAADFEARATLQNGSTPTSGTMDTWLALSSDRTWSLTAAAGVSDGCQFLIEIRRASDGVILDSASIQLDVYNDGGS